MNMTEAFKYLFESYNVTDFYLGYVKYTYLGVSDSDAMIEIGGVWRHSYYHTVLLKLSDGSFIDIRYPENKIERELMPDSEGYTLEYAESVIEYCDPKVRDEGKIFGFRALMIGKENRDSFDRHRVLALTPDTNS